MMYGKNLDSEETWKRIPENSTGVEIGVWKGRSSEKFLKKAKFVHLVDSWSVIPYTNNDEHGSYENYLSRYETLVGSKNPTDFQKFYDNIYLSVQTKFKNKPVKIHRLTSKEFFDSFNEQVDWVYVDADHSYEGCLFDLNNSLKIIRSGGYIFGDDYTNKPGVKKAVDQFILETGLILNNFYGSQYEIKVN